jgi:hypothetical protein
MKNFDEKEKQIQEICDRVRNSDYFENELKLAFYDINKIVREAYYEGYSDGVAKVAEIHKKYNI